MDNRCESWADAMLGRVQCIHPLGHPGDHESVTPGPDSTNVEWPNENPVRQDTRPRAQLWQRLMEEAGGNRDEILLRLHDRVTELETATIPVLVCTAVLHLPALPTSPFHCLLPSGHGGPHRDGDGDAWEITGP